mgnify:CR=1 FL=1
MFQGSVGVDLSVIPSWMILLGVFVIGIVTAVAVWILTPCVEHLAFRKAGFEHQLEYELPCSVCLSDAKPEESQEKDNNATQDTTINTETEIEVQIDNTEGEQKNSSSDENRTVESAQQNKQEPPAEDSLDVPNASEEFDPCTEQLFSMGQVLMAIVGSFAHGANDIANAIGPFAVVIGVYNTGQIHSNEPIPWWILAMGGVGIVTGLAMWGYRVIKTIGEKLTKVTPSRGFNIELGSAITVMSASRIGIPLSTTHCKVGAVVGVGLCDGGAAVQWRMVGNIMVGWVCSPFVIRFYLLA